MLLTGLFFFSNAFNLRAVVKLSHKNDGKDSILDFFYLLSHKKNWFHEQSLSKNQAEFV